MRVNDKKDPRTQGRSAAGVKELNSFRKFSADEETRGTGQPGRGTPGRGRDFCVSCRGKTQAHVVNGGILA